MVSAAKVEKPTPNLQGSLWDASFLPLQNPLYSAVGPCQGLRELVP